MATSVPTTPREETPVQIATSSTRSCPTRGPRPTHGLTGSFLAVALVLLGACGGDDDGEEADPSSGPTPLTADAALLESGSFVSTDVTGHEMVDGTVIELGFQDATMSVSAGCNTMFGGFDVQDGVLRFSDEPAATMIGCEEDLAAQDEWLRGLFTAGLDATTDGANLDLATDDVTVAMGAEPLADLETLLGRTWSVVGTISDGSTSRVPPPVRTPRLVVGADGLSRLDTGCNTGRTRVSVDRVSVSFSTPTTTRAACPEPAGTVEDIVLSVVDGRSDYVRYDGSVLILVKDGAGLVFSIT